MVDALKAKDHSIRNATLISIKSMFKHAEMQKGAHFTIVCTILLIGLGSKIKKTLQRSMYMNPYNKFL